MKLPNPFSIIILVILIPFFLNSKVIILASQADVEAFCSTTTEIHGDLYIGVEGSISDIVDLSNLGNLFSISGNLDAHCNVFLTNVDGLSNLISISRH